MMSFPVSSFATYVLCSQSERQISAVCDGFVSCRYEKEIVTFGIRAL